MDSDYPEADIIDLMGRDFDPAQLEALIYQGAGFAPRSEEETNPDE